MAILFDGSTDFYTITAIAALELGDEDWCVGIWTRTVNDSGSANTFLISNGNTTGDDSLNLQLRGSAVSTPDAWRVFFSSSGGDVQIDSSSAPGADGVDRLIIIQRDTGASLFRLHFCEFGQTATAEGTVSDAGITTHDAGNWNIGRRRGGASLNYDGVAAEYFSGKFNLSLEEITALGAGMPIWALGKSPNVYLPFQSAGHSQIDLFSTNDGNENGTPANAEHFKIRSRSPILITRDAGAAATEAAFALAVTPAMVLAGDAISEAAFALAVTPAMVALADATSEAAVAMAATAGLTFNGLVTSEGALALQTVAAMLITGDALVEGSLTLPVIPGVTFAGDEDTDVALALAMTAGVTFTGQVTAEASVSLAAIAALGMTAGSAAEAGLDIATTFAMGVVADALAEAGLSLDAITSITIVGEQVIISIEVSPGRTITVAIEARVILVDAEARTLIVDAENRTITVKDDGQ